MDSWRGWNMTKAVGYELVATKRIVIVNLDVKLGPTLETFGSKMNINGMAPKQE